MDCLANHIRCIGSQILICYLPKNDLKVISYLQSNLPYYLNLKIEDSDNTEKLTCVLNTQYTAVGQMSEEFRK